MLMGSQHRISETLVQGDDIPGPPLQLIRAHPLQRPQPPLTDTPWEPQRTHYEITWQQPTADMATPAPSEDRLSDEMLSPVHLQRTVHNSLAMRLSPAHFPQFKDIAGSPVASTFKPRFEGVSGKFFHGDELHESQQLSLISSYHSFGPLPTPDFDSTGHVIRLAQPGGTALPLFSAQRACVTPALSTVAQRSWEDDAPLSPQVVAHSGAPLALPQRGEKLEDFNEHQVHFAHPAPSRTLHDAWQALMQTPPPVQPVPGSAPPALYRSMAKQGEFETLAALDSDDAAADAGDFPVVELVASQDAMQ